MKQVLHITMLIFVLALTACSQKRPAQRISSRDTVRGPTDSIGGGGNVTNLAQACGSNCLWGKIYENDYGTTFEDNVKKFGSANVPRSEIGTIDSTLNGTSTGVWFWGSVPLQGGNLTSFANGSAQTVSIASNSKLAIAIYDSFTVNNTAVKPIATLFSGAEGGSVQGTITKSGGSAQVSLRFADQWGSVILEGTITTAGGSLNDALFSGSIGFTNKCEMNADATSCDPTNDSSITRLGAFSVKACGFFGCN